MVWTIIVTNHGPDDALNVRVNDTIPSGLINVKARDGYDGSFDPKSGIWSIDKVVVGYPKYLILETTVNATNTTLPNKVNVTSDTYDPFPDNNTAENKTKVLPEADLEINKTVQGDNIHNGSTVTWTITVKNNGPDNATNVRVTDVLPKGLVSFEVDSIDEGKFVNGVWTIDEIAPGVSKRLVLKSVINGTNMTVLNEVNVTSDTPDPNPDNNNATNKTYIPPEADLKIIKLVSNATAHKGDVINWTVIVTNKGPNTALNVIVNETIPQGFSYYKFVNNYKGIFDERYNQWHIGDLSKDEEAILIIETQINTTNETIINIVNVTSDTYDPNETNNNATNSTYIPPEADLVIVKTVSNSTPHKGDKVVWTVVVTNNGPDVAVNVVVTEKLPSGLIYDSDDTDGRYNMSSGVWKAGDLVKGANATLNIVTIVDTTNDTVVNFVNTSSDVYDPNPDNNNATNSSTVPPEADLEAVITNNFEDDPDSVCHYGDTIVWTVTVVNHGPDVAVNTTLDDLIPDGCIYVSDDGEGKYNSSTGVWSIGDLPVGVPVVLKITTTANVTNDTVYRFVNVSSDTYDPNLSNNYNDSSVVVPPEADLVIVKTVSNSTPHKGDKVVWTVVVTNNGPDVAVNVVVTEKLPSGLIYDSDDTDGRYNMSSGVWKAGDLVKGANATLNIVTIVDTTNDTVVNFVNTSSDVYDPNPDNNNATNSSTVPPEADLEAVITNNFEDDPDSVCHYGDTIVWTVTVVNHGPDVAVNTTLDDLIPDGCIYVSDDGEGKYNSSTGVWSIGDLPVGVPVVLKITTTANVTNDTVYRFVNVSSDTYDPNLSNNYNDSSVVVPPEADIEVIKLVSNDAPHKGDKITWTIIVTNNGPDTAVNAKVIDRLPKGLKYISDDSLNCYNPESGIWEIGYLASGESIQLNIVTKVVTTNKTIVNVADVDSDTHDPNETNNHCNSSTTVPPEADLVITVVPDVIEVFVGDKVVYTVTVVNEGPDTAVNSNATINIPEELKLLGFEPSKGTYDPETGIWTIGDIAPGEEVTLLLETEALKSGIIIVEASVISDTFERNLLNNYDNTEILVKDPPAPNVPADEKMPATGNPIAMVLLSMLAIVGITIRRKY